MNKLFIQDLGSYGSIIVIAESLNEAREIMRNSPNFEMGKYIFEIDIKKGFMFYNIGDM